ncbi:hypothetical protein JCM10213_004446 [Rhodosporidiobolus nylandii]
MARRRAVQTHTPPTVHNAFRTAERHWKSASYDLSLAFDAEQIAWDAKEDEGGRRRGVWMAGDGEAVECFRVALGDLEEAKMGQIKWKGKAREEDGDYAIIVPRIPGLVIFPSVLSETLQRALVVETLQHACRPNLSNLDKHYTLPEGGLWNVWLAGRGDEVVPALPDEEEQAASGQDAREAAATGAAERKSEGTLPEEAKETGARTASEKKAVTVRELLPKLRWSNVGWHYNWTTKLYEFERGKPALPPLVLRCCRDIVRVTPWEKVLGESGGDEEVGGTTRAHWRSWNEDYEPDAGIINFYQLKDTLTAHTDHSEKDATRPLVSFSLGHSSVFLVGGTTRDIPPLAILLRSGDGLCLSGPGRLAYHGLPRVLAGTLPPFLAASQPLPVEGTDDWRPYGEYLERGARINVNVRSVF